MANVTLTITRKTLKKDYFQRLALSNTSGKSTSLNIHREMARFRNETSYNVVITFPKPFISKPIGVDNLKVYRMFEVETGKWGMRDVLFTFPSEEDWLTETGFEINIDPIESLVGIWIEYNFTE